MSTISQAGKLLKGSERESKFNFKAFAGLAAGLVLLWFAGRSIMSGDNTYLSFAQRPMPEATTAPVPTMTQYVVGPIEEEATATPTAWPTPIIIEKEKTIVVTVEVPGQPVYMEVPGPVVEVTRIVEVAAVVLPTITPVPLAPGTIRICASVEGATALYIGDKGVVSGGCESFSFGVGQSSISVKVNK